MNYILIIINITDELQLVISTDKNKISSWIIRRLIKIPSGQLYAVRCRRDILILHKFAAHLSRRGVNISLTSWRATYILRKTRAVSQTIQISKGRLRNDQDRNDRSQTSTFALSGNYKVQVRRHQVEKRVSKVSICNQQLDRLRDGRINTRHVTPKPAVR